MFYLYDTRRSVIYVAANGRFENSLGAENGRLFRTRLSILRVKLLKLPALREFRCNGMDVPIKGYC
jgi:hypothetical protein